MGDLRIRAGGASGFGGIGQALKAGAIDANSKMSGDFTEKVNVNGRDVFLTKAGAAAFEKFKAEGADGVIFSPRVEEDPGFFARIFLGGVKEDPATVGKP